MRIQPPLPDPVKGNFRYYVVTVPPVVQSNRLQNIKLRLRLQFNSLGHYLSRI